MLQDVSTDLFWVKTRFLWFCHRHLAKRTNKLHRTHADSVRFARCQTEVNAVVRNTGAKYSVLFQFPYYDAGRFVIIDPMHKLLLGLAKTTLTCCRGELMLLFHRQKLEGSLQSFPQDSVDLQQTSGRTGFVTIQYLH